jgi:flagellar biosynthesis anti-sigma factor FlgM
MQNEDARRDVLAGTDAMRISDPNRPENVAPPAAENSPAEVAPHVRPNPEGAVHVAPDQADLSNVAGRLSEILTADSSRSERILQLREAVGNGTYQVDSAAVSRAMVEEALSTKPGDGQT